MEYVDTLETLFEELALVWSPDHENQHSVESVQLLLCGMYPPRWQCTIKYLHSGPWAVAVEDTAAQALGRALDVSLRGKDARATDSDCIFHRRRSDAERAVGIAAESTDLPIAFEVQFEPYWGWVVVAFFDPAHTSREEAAEAVGPHIELREGGPASTTLDPTAGRAGRPRAILEQEWRMWHGKRPPAGWSDAELARKLDETQGDL